MDLGSRSMVVSKESKGGAGEGVSQGGEIEEKGNRREFVKRRRWNAYSWKPRLIQRFSLERERCIWEGEILGYTGGFSPEQELYHPGEKWQFWAV
ncbi:hypothetical protein Lal_00022146 [Lupinus albus]|nr:hypothetical protein Lal_00022146 [Lupinus albus]